MNNQSFFLDAVARAAVWAAALFPPAATAWGQTTLATAGKAVTSGNPLCPFAFCADPTAIVHDGRVYVYGTNDHQSFSLRGSGTDINYGDINTLVVLSSDDMVNWTYHGTIDMKAVCGSWLYASWAPSIVSRIEADSLTHFYMYFSNGGSVGVVTATSPLGPWSDPLGHALIDASTDGLGLCSTPFDPGVCIDDDGVAWLSFGGGSPNAEGSTLMPGNARIVRLGADMISLDSPIVPIPAPYQFEASELNYIGGQYVYTFNTSWSSRDDWASYGSSLAAPSTCSMCYMTTTDPLGGDGAWTYRGEYFANPGTFGLGWGNNHTHLQAFDGSYYLFYHTRGLQDGLGYSGDYRSIAVNKAAVYETNAKISTVTGDTKGVTQLKRVDALAPQQAEMMCTSAGIYATRRGTEGNAVLIRIDDGDWTMTKGVQFGTDGATRCRVRVRGTGSIDIRVGSLTAKSVGSVDFATPSATYEDVEFPLTTAIKGSKDLYFVFGGSEWNFDEWQFYTDTADGIDTVRRDAPSASATDAATASATASHDLLGRRTASDGAGIVVRDGRKTIRCR